MWTLEQAATDFNARSRAENWEQICDPTNRFAMPECTELIALWRRAGPPHELPRREALGPRSLKPYLSRLSLVEQVETAPPRFRFRLIGTNVTRTLRERTGRFFEEDATPAQIGRWTQASLITLGARAPVRFMLMTEHLMVGEMLTLPLSDAAGEARFVLGYGRYEPTRDWSRPVEHVAAL